VVVKLTDYPCRKDQPAPFQPFFYDIPGCFYNLSHMSATRIIAQCAAISPRKKKEKKKKRKIQEAIHNVFQQLTSQ
jgi:hypothetical protein